MTLLAIDTSAEFCAVCIYDMANGAVLSKQSENIGRGHAEKLMPVIETCLKSAGRDYSDLTKIGVTNGPGSFTGVRVGLATGRGLALSLNVPIATVTTLEACIQNAKQVDQSENQVAIIDARRDEAYVQVNAQAPFIAPYDEIAKRLPDQFKLCGSGAARFNEIAGLTNEIIHAQSTGDIETITSMISAKLPDKLAPEPLYLRSADAKPQSGFTLARA